ncbi:hypothetical protein MOLA_15930 [Moorella thermoacetica]|uniref:glycosyltransferase family 4 protein n=1 Tax=Neomoorella thermoacetica TaxID=1525 RepID=UPI00126FB9B3|nr:glycosyltransferase [Moorella thermoacetica]TYL08693.1 hypothetical protein MOLA_15930 [Moorella thermoacetica]
MKTRILVISEYFSRGGLETHIVGQARVLSKLGVDLLLATGSSAADCPDGVFAAALTDLRMGAQVSYDELCVTLKRLKKFISDERITLIHAHPFYSAIVGLLAAQQSRLPFVVTIHSPLSLSSTFGQLYDFLLKSVVLPVAGRVFCVSKETELLCRSLAECRTELLLNAVQIQNSNPPNVAKDGPWLWAGRLDKDKSNGLLDLIEKIDQATVGELHIFGDGPQVHLIESFLNSRPDKAEFVRLMGWRHNITTIMPAYAGIAGMGRVILEGSALNRPCLLVGYDGVKGLLDINRFERASFWNFSGRGLPTITADALHQEFYRLSKDKGPFLLRQWVADNRDERVIWQRYAEKIKDLAPLDNPLAQNILDALQYRGSISEPVWWDKELMRVILGLFSNEPYGKEQAKSMTHQILVAHLHSKLEAIKYETTMLREKIDFLKSALAERDEKITSLNQAVAERDEKIISLNQAVIERDEKIASLQKHIQDIWASTSWRITRPLRFLKKLVSDPEPTTYFILKRIYWGLPGNLRIRLNGLRCLIIRFFLSKRKNNVGLMANQEGIHGLSWEEFQDKVLSKREQHKGIFILEATHIDWNMNLFQRPQHMANALSKLGYLVIFKTANFYDNVSGFKKISDNLWLTNNDKVDSIYGAVRSFYSTSSVYTKEIYDDRRKYGLVVYEYIDHIDPAISGDEENIRRLNALKNYAFNGGVDFIVASAKALYREAVQAVGEDKVILIPNGVDVEHYRDQRHKYCTIPKSLIKFKNVHKIIMGYFGALAPWLWYEEIEKLAALRPEVGFVFIGPDYYGGSSLLPKAKNIFWMGPVDYKILPGYALHFDICFIPFRPGEIARTTSPLKLFEYFALEKPVIVTSSMLECIQFCEVLSGSCATELSKCIDKALDLSRDEHFKKRLAELADQNSWIERAKKYEIIFEQTKKWICHKKDI